MESGEFWLVRENGQFVKLTNDGKLTVSDGHGASVALNGAGTVSSSGTWTHTGDMTVTGNIGCDVTVTGDADVIAAGISGKSHVHPGVQSGEGDTEHRRERTYPQSLRQEPIIFNVVVRRRECDALPAVNAVGVYGDRTLNGQAFGPINGDGAPGAATAVVLSGGTNVGVGGKLLGVNVQRICGHVAFNGARVRRTSRRASRSARSPKRRE